MEEKLFFPAGISEAGGRAANEDAIWPAPVHIRTTDNVFVVCDGVGGLRKGSLASTTASRIIGESLRKVSGDFVQGDFVRAVRAAYAEFDERVAEQPSVKGMATTLALVAIDAKGVWIGHVGDSRVYHMREGKVLWRTRDHSFVEELMARGALTGEEAIHHPNRHVITRAIQAGSKRHLPELEHATDVQPGDWFLICSDGLTDRVPESELPAIWDTKEEPANALETLAARCNAIDGDNFSAWLVPVSQSMFHPIPEAELAEEETEISENTENPSRLKRLWERISPFTLVDDE